MGPPIALLTATAGTGRRDKLNPVSASGDGAWTGYLPTRLRAHMVGCLGPRWLQWLCVYIVQTLNASPIKRNLVRTYVTHVYNVFVKELTCTNMNDFLMLARGDIVSAIVRVNPHRTHQQRLCRSGSIRWQRADPSHRGEPFSEQYAAARLCIAGAPIVCAHQGSPRNHKNTTGGQRPSGGLCDQRGRSAVASMLRRRSRTRRVRDHFTEAEIEALLRLPLTKRDALVLHILAETGLRRRAVSWLLVDGVYDRCAKAALPVARALEKGLVMRPFVLSPRTRALLTSYMEDEHPGSQYRWLFPSPKKGYQYPMNPSSPGGPVLGKSEPR